MTKHPEGTSVLIVFCVFQTFKTSTVYSQMFIFVVFIDSAEASLSNRVTQLTKMTLCIFFLLHENKLDTVSRNISPVFTHVHDCSEGNLFVCSHTETHCGIMLLHPVIKQPSAL